jgi:hypothetical protein
MPEQLVMGIDHLVCFFFVYHGGILTLNGGCVKL